MFLRIVGVCRSRPVWRLFYGVLTRRSNLVRRIHATLCIQLEAGNLITGFDLLPLHLVRDVDMHMQRCRELFIPRQCNAVLCRDLFRGLPALVFQDRLFRGFASLVRGW